MFENNSFIYYFTIVYFVFRLPFALFSTIMSFYYFFSWIFSRKAQLINAAVYCFVDGILSLAFGCIGIWLVVNEIANIWFIFLIAVIIDVPYIFIARRIRTKVFQITTPIQTKLPTTDFNQ